MSTITTTTTTTTTNTTTTIFVVAIILSALVGKEMCVNSSHKNATFISWKPISKQRVFCAP